MCTNKPLGSTYSRMSKSVKYVEIFLPKTKGDQRSWNSSGNVRVRQYQRTAME